MADSMMQPMGTGSQLLPKLSEALTAEQKDRKIGNLLTNLRRAGRLVNAGTRAQPIWSLVESKKP